MPAGIPIGYSSRAEWIRDKQNNLSVVSNNPLEKVEDDLVEDEINRIESEGWMPSGPYLDVGDTAYGVTSVSQAEKQIQSLEEVNQLNKTFSEDGEAADYWTNVYAEKRNEYQSLWKELDEKGDEQGKINLNTQYQAILDKRKMFLNDTMCTFEKGGKDCAEGSVNWMDSVGTGLDLKGGEEFTIQDMKSNRPLLESLQRTYGAYNKDKKLKTKDELINEWIRAQHFFEYNFAKKGIEGLKSLKMTDEQKQDFAVQWVNFQKLLGSEDDGGISLSAKWENITAAILSDPTTYYGGNIVRQLIKFGGKKLLKKDLEKEAVKVGIKKFLSGSIAQGANKGFKVGATYMAADNLSDQRVLIQGGVQENVNLLDTSIDALAGGIAGYGFGIGIGGGSAAVKATLKNLADDYLIKSNLSNQQVIDEIGLAVQDEKSLKKFLKKIGWSSKDVKAEVVKKRAEGFDYAVPTVVRNSEEAILGTPNKEKFIAEQSTLVTPRTQRLAESELIPPRKVKTPDDIKYNDSILRARDRVEKTEAGEKALMADMVNVGNVVLPKFNRWGYNTYKYINDQIGSGLARTVYGPDIQLINSGARNLGEAMYGANVAIDINVARINGKLAAFIKQNKKELGDTNRLIENGVNAKGVTPVQKQYINMVLKDKKAVLTDAAKSGVISRKDFNKFIKDTSYVPRIWNTAYLTDPKGAAEFKNYLQAALKKSPKSTEKLIQNISGSKEYTKEFLSGEMNAKDIKRLWFMNAMDRTNIKRSTHLEKTRKFVIPARMERDLDPFMAPAAERWQMFFADTIKRNEYAKRFGADDERVTKFIKQLRKDGKNTEADDVQEIYFTAVGDPLKSAVIRNVQDVNSKMSGRAISRINALQNHKLGLAFIPNATQTFVNGTTELARSGNLVTLPYKAISSLVRAIVKSPQDMADINAVGVLGDMDLAKILTENSPSARIIDREFKGPWKFLNEPTQFLRATGFMSVERLNRRGAAVMGVGHVKYLHTKLQKLIKNGKGDSKIANKLQREMKELGVADPLRTELSAQDIAIAGHMFNKRVNFSGESATLPVNWSKPWYKLATKFKSFMFFQARFLKRSVADELFINKNPAPLLTYMAFAGIGGNAIEQVRSLLTGRDIEENRNAFELLINGIGNAGAFGLWFDTLQQVGERGSSALAGIAGPTISDALDTLGDLSKGDIDKIILRLVPNIPGKGYLKDAWRDI